MIGIVTLFKELFGRFPWAFLLLFGFILLQSILNVISLLAIAPLADFLMGKTGSEVSHVTKYFSYMISFLVGEPRLLHILVLFAIVTFVSMGLESYKRTRNIKPLLN